MARNAPYRAPTCPTWDANRSACMHGGRMSEENWHNINPALGTHVPHLGCEQVCTHAWGKG
eukprot:1161593-Pelagomonas_calceolata.AAC.17